MQAVCLHQCDTPIGMENLDVDELQRRLAGFAAARGWQKFHTPKNLATALVVEAAELNRLGLRTGFGSRPAPVGVAIVERSTRPHTRQA